MYSNYLSSQLLNDVMWDY